MIFIHGLMGSWQNWRRVIPAFENQYQVLAYDQRGHGRSFKPSTGFAPEDYAEDLVFLMDQLEIQSPIIVGHSMGGRNAMCFAKTYPGKVKKLVIEDIGPQAVARVGSQVVDKLKMMPREFESKLAAKDFLLNSFGDPKLGMFMYTNILSSPQGKGVWAFNLENMIETIQEGRGESRWADVEGIQCPTLLIRGGKSEELPLDEYEEMLRRNSNIQGTQIPDAGHWVHFEQPDLFIEKIQSFISQP